MDYSNIVKIVLCKMILPMSTNNTSFLGKVAQVTITLVENSNVNCLLSTHNICFLGKIAQVIITLVENSNVNYLTMKGLKINISQ